MTFFAYRPIYTRLPRYEDEPPFFKVEMQPIRALDAKTAAGAIAEAKKLGIPAPIVGLEPLN